MCTHSDRRGGGFFFRESELLHTAASAGETIEPIFKAISMSSTFLLVKLENNKPEQRGAAHLRYRAVGSVLPYLLQLLS